MPEKIQKVVVGISTYGPFPRAHNLIKGIWNNLEETKQEVTLLCVDDGTPQKDVVRERAAFCRKWNVQFLHNETNLGIPATWNRMLDFCVNNKADLLVIFSDGVRVGVPGWMTRLIYYFDNNEDVGSVGLPTVDTEGFDDQDPRWWGPVARVGAAVGSSFAVRPEDMLAIENFDGSKGYATSLISFHEEIMAGFKLAELGRLSCMLPFPPCYYRGGMAFGAHSELTWREPCLYLPMDKFLQYVRQSKWYVKEFEEFYSQGKVDRMSYSRILACQEWGVLDEVDAGRRVQEIKGEMVDILDDPPKFYHPKCVDIWPPRVAKWLDRDGQIQTRDDF